MPQQNNLPAGPSHVFYRRHARAKPTVSHGAGVYLWDTTGKRYLDAAGGAVVANLGHGLTAIAAAMGEQAAAVAYAHAAAFTSEAVETLAEQLAARLPLPDARLYFLCSGSEAVEAALKLARQLQQARGQAGRDTVIAREGSYHGLTLGALAVSGRPAARAGYEPLFRDMPHIAPVFCYHCPFGLAYPSCDLRCADALAEEIERREPDSVIAFIAEPVAGATLGAVVPPPGYWPRIRQICDRYGVLIIADEVMTGIGRTGCWFACELVDLSPDIMCLGKGLSGGYAALSAVAVRGDLVELLWEKVGDFNHGGTFSHQPVAAAAGVATMVYLEEHDLVARAAALGELLGHKLHAAFDGHPYVGDVRGCGLLWAIEIVADRATGQPFAPAVHLATTIADLAFDEGLIVYPGRGCVDGTAGDHIILAPPFVVSESQLDEIVAGLGRAVDAALGASASPVHQAAEAAATITKPPSGG